MCTSPEYSVDIFAEFHSDIYTYSKSENYDTEIKVEIDNSIENILKFGTKENQFLPGVDIEMSEWQYQNWNLDKSLVMMIYKKNTYDVVAM